MAGPLMPGSQEFFGFFGALKKGEHPKKLSNVVNAALEASFGAIYMYN
jgi:hypothetical protein